MKVKPINNKIILKETKQEEQTKSGLFIGGGEEEKYSQNRYAVVYHPGNTDFKEGQKVIYDSYRAKRVKFEGEILVFLEPKEIIADI